MDKCTPNYVVRKETKRDKMRIRTAKLAMKFEEKAKTRQGQRKWVEECIKEREERRNITKGTLERDEYLRRCGVGEEELEQWRRQGRIIAEELSRRDRDVQIEEQELLIDEARYNTRYKGIRVEELLEYLKGRGERGSHKRRARARCGNEERKNRFWLQEEDRKCDICRWEEDTFEHLLERCSWKSSSMVEIEDILGEKETEQGNRWLREWKGKRKEVEKQKRKSISYRIED